MPKKARPSRPSDSPSVQVATADAYERLCDHFAWQVPQHFNMAQLCSVRWAADAGTGAQICIREHRVGKRTRSYTYAQLHMAATAMAGQLHRLGVRTGDRVGIVLPQRFETAVAYMAVLGMGAVAMPLSQLFGPEALAYRFTDSEAVAAVVDAATYAAVQSVMPQCPALKAVLNVDARHGSDSNSDSSAADGAEILKQKTAQTWAHTLADDPAVLIYTSGTTGDPKGALIPHRALLGNLTGFVASQNWFGFDPSLPTSQQNSQAVFWSPADWAWTGGLMDALLPTLYFGREIVAYSGRFTPEVAFDILQSQRVTHSFLFPTALKAMMKAVPEPRKTYAFQLQALMSAGEAVGDAVFAWCQNQLGVQVNEMFGQTEINYIVGNCNMVGTGHEAWGWASKPGSMGKGYPGHRVAVIDDAGRVCTTGELGEVAVHRLDRHGHPDPVFFLGYWKKPQATRDKYTADPQAAPKDAWCRTGDLAYADADGYLWYQGRADDMFKSSGYRIGPGEIENCLVKHPAVLNAAVVPKPDFERGAVVKAYVVLSPDYFAKLESKGLAKGGKKISPDAGGKIAIWVDDMQEKEAKFTKNDTKYIANNGVDVRQSAKNAPKSPPHWQTDLILELQRHVKGLLAPYEYPKEIEFVDALPMTTTGKVQRRVLRLQELARSQAFG